MGKEFPSIDDLKFIRARDGRIYRLSRMIAHDYRTIAATLGLSSNTVIVIERDTEFTDRINKVFYKWLNNANELPNNYPLSWEGLRNILIDSELAAVAEKFFSILKDVDCDQSSKFL